MVSCAMDVPFPACTSHASLLSAVIWVAGTVCYEKDYRPGCTMPEFAPPLYPVEVNGSRTASPLRSELFVDGGDTGTAKTLYIRNDVPAVNVRLDGTAVVGTVPGARIETLTVSAANVRIESVTVGNLTFVSGTTPGALQVVNTVLETPLSLIPTPQQHTLKLDGALFQNIRGGAVAMLRHTGTATCSGPLTRCFVMPRNDPGQISGTVVSDGGAVVINITAITDVYGDPYLIDFFGFNKEEEARDASALMVQLILPTVICLASVFLSHGRKVQSQNVD